MGLGANKASGYASDQAGYAKSKAGGYAQAGQAKAGGAYDAAKDYAEDASTYVQGSAAAG